VESADGGTLLQRFAYALDENGNRVGTTVTGAAATSGTESYAYDELDRMTDVTYVDGLHVAYAYDANGNRLSQDDGTTATTFAYDAADELTDVDGVLTYGYDADGNRVTAGGNTFQYDWRGRLAAATVGGTAVGYGYDGQGVRVTRTVGGVTTSELRDREWGLPELVQEGGAGGTSYVQGPAGAVAETDGSGATYPLRDGIGTSRATTDGSGAVVGTRDYDAWGTLRAQSGAGSRHGWAGEVRDDATGLTYLRARDYSPGTGRFASADDVQPNGPGTQGYNPYAYATNNPATYVDPSGHDGEAFLGGGGAETSFASEAASAAEDVVVSMGWRSGAAALTDTVLSEAPAGVGSAAIGGTATAEIGVVGGELAVDAAVAGTVSALFAITAMVVFMLAAVVMLLIMVQLILYLAEYEAAMTSRGLDPGLTIGHLTSEMTGTVGSTTSVTWTGTGSGTGTSGGVEPGADTGGDTGGDTDPCDGASDFDPTDNGPGAKRIPPGQIPLPGVEMPSRCKKKKDNCDREKTKEQYWMSVARNPILRHELSVLKGFPDDGANLARMRDGDPPRRANPKAPNGYESLELHHAPVPCRDGGKAVIPLWPCEHADIDPYRNRWRPDYC
jgi:RHS repeat-associated protein